MTALGELRQRKEEYEEELCNILDTEEINKILTYEFRQDTNYSDIDNLEIAVTSTGKLIAGYTEDEIFYLVTDLDKTLFLDKSADPSLKFSRHKEFLPKLGIDAHKDISGSVVKLKDGRIVTMLSDGTILEK